MLATNRYEGKMMNKMVKEIIISIILVLISIYVWAYIMHLPQYSWREWYGFPTMLTAIFTTAVAYILPAVWGK